MIQLVNQNVGCKYTEYISLIMSLKQCCMDVINYNKEMDKYKKKNPFTVPEGYFDELTGRITGRIEKQKEVKKSSSLRGLKPYMGLVAIFFLALMVVQILFPGAKNTDLPDIEGENAIVQEMEAEDIFDSQFNPTNEEIIEYLASEVDNYEMILAGIY